MGGGTSSGDATGVSSTTGSSAGVTSSTGGSIAFDFFFKIPHEKSCLKILTFSFVSGAAASTGGVSSTGEVAGVSSVTGAGVSSAVGSVFSSVLCVKSGVSSVHVRSS